MNETQRSMRDRAVLEHLTTGPMKPARHPSKKPQVDQETGEAVEHAIEKRSSSRTGRGLAEF
jgi:hypothetical protein